MAMRTREQIAVQQERRAARGAVELWFEDWLVSELTASGERCLRQVRTACGRADVVTDDAVYEVKNELGREELLKGFGQVTVYAQCLGKRRRVLIGRRVSGNAALESAIEQQGVEVQFIDIRLLLQHPKPVAATQIGRRRR